MRFWLLVPIPLASFVLACVATALMIRLAPRWGFVDHPGGYKKQKRPMPLGGGIAIFLGLWLTVYGGMVVLETGGTWLKPIVRTLLRVDETLPLRARETATCLNAIFLGAAFLLIVGIIDDRRGMSPWVKLACQTVAALFIVFTGTTATVFIGRGVGAVITIFWVVAITNAFNFMDNMDGLSAGVAFVVSFLLFLIGIQTAQILVAAMLLALMGALVGFLIFNFPPAKIYMGDAGSLPVGYVLAGLSVVFTFHTWSDPAHTIAVPLLIMAVPLFDMVSVVLIRLHKGHSPFAGDRNHFSHRLVDLGMSTREAVLTIYFLTFCIGIIAPVLYRVPPLTALVVLCQVVGVFIVIYMLERAGRRRVDGEKE